MKNQYNSKSYLDDQLKQLDKDIHWKETRKNSLENDILFSMNRKRKKTKIVYRLKYALSVTLMGIVLFFGYSFFADSLTFQDERSSLNSEGNQTEETLSINDEDDLEEDMEKEELVETGETKMEVITGSTETVTREAEGMEQEVEVINYQIQPYRIAYQLDKVFGSPEVTANEIKYSIDDEYIITLAIIDNINLDDAVANLQERFETEGYEEKFELENTLKDENNFTGKIQYFGYYPVKGFIAYQIDDNVLEITFQYPEEAGDGMYFLLESLRTSIFQQ